MWMNWTKESSAGRSMTRALPVLPIRAVLPQRWTKALNQNDIWHANRYCVHAFLHCYTPSSTVLSDIRKDQSCCSLLDQKEIIGKYTKMYWFGIHYAHTLDLVHKTWGNHPDYFIYTQEKQTFVNHHTFKQILRWCMHLQRLILYPIQHWQRHSMFRSPPPPLPTPPLKKK